MVLQLPLQLDTRSARARLRYGIRLHNTKTHTWMIMKPKLTLIINNICSSIKCATLYKCLCVQVCVCMCVILFSNVASDELRLQVVCGYVPEKRSFRTKDEDEDEDECCHAGSMSRTVCAQVGALHSQLQLVIVIVVVAAAGIEAHT